MSLRTSRWHGTTPEGSGGKGQGNMSQDNGSLDAVSVTVTKADSAELYFMLRGRGGSGLKTKLLAALSALDPKGAHELLTRERSGGAE